MPDERTGAGAWVRGLFRRGGNDRAEYDGDSARTDPRQAVETVERLLCESICRVSRTGAARSPETNAFGRPVEVVDLHDAASTVATAAGLAMSGRRAAAFLGAHDLAAACPGVRAAARRCLPLVLHATIDPDQDHAGCHALADAGAFVLFASDAQEAIDLTLLARRVAERALLPGVVVIDAAPIEVDLRQPEADLVRSFVGAPDETIASPTPAQLLIFGEQRRPLPRWFDPVRPVAHGVASSGPSEAAAVAGRRAFFTRHLPSVAQESIEEFARLTGRSCDLVRRHRLEGAQSVVVAQGAAVAQIAAVADRMNGPKAGGVGILGITWLQPFPAAQVREALADARGVTVLERCDLPADVPPLMREVRSALGAKAPRLLSATHGVATDEQLRALLVNMQAGDAARPVVRLGVVPPTTGSAYPKREALLQRIHRDYPDLGSETLDHPERAQRAEGSSPRADRPAAPPPLAVRRLAHASSTYDNVARFWGEHAQPRGEDEDQPLAPDPYLATGTVPAYTATFHEARVARDELPRIDAEACTGCGRCWALCPHSALAPLAIGTQSLLEALAQPDAADEAAAKLQRVLRQLAQRFNGLLAKSEGATVDGALLDQAFEWLVEQMKVSAQERPGFERAFRPIAERVVGLPLSVTEPFFLDVERQTKGGGELLLLSVEARACTGCGICAASCDDDALQMEARSPAAVAAMQELHRHWERLPDTPGPTIARAGKDERVGPLASILMSRHCSLSLPGGDAAEPGSGERLAVRQLAAVVEFEMQRRTVAHVDALDDLARRLRATIGDAMAGAVKVEELDHLDTALRDVPQRAVNVGDVLDRMSEAGGRTELDVPHARGLVRAAIEIEQLRREISEGQHGTGRARFGVVVAGASVAEWAARFPRNPFGVPLSVDLGGNGADVALGLARGLLATRVEEARRIRTAELVLDAPSDLPARQRDLEGLRPHDLTAQERALCPPLLVICGADSFGATDFAGISRLLASGLPIKLVVLDGHDLAAPLVDPSLLGLAQHRASVLATSVAHPAHLAEGMAAALDGSGASLIHVYAPSPDRHGFDPRDTIGRARSAVAARIHPLLRFEPGLSAPDLTGNPAPDRTWAPDAEDRPQTPAEWAAGESRFDSQFTTLGECAGLPIVEWLSKSPDERGAYKPTVPGPNGGRLVVGDLLASAVAERRSHWLRLQEAAGLRGPSAEAARARAAAELGAAHAEALEALRDECEQKIEEVEKHQLASQAARLRARLLQLAGFGARGGERRRDPS